jgi:hypothetical protein
MFKTQEYCIPAIFGELRVGQIADGPASTRYHRWSAWYLNIPVDLQPKPGPVKMEKMEKFLVRMGNLLLEWRNLL